MMMRGLELFYFISEFLPPIQHGYEEEKWGYLLPKKEVAFPCVRMGLQQAKSAGPCLKLLISVTSETAPCTNLSMVTSWPPYALLYRLLKCLSFLCVLCVDHYQEKSVRIYAENTLYRYSFTDANLVFRAHECLKSHFLLLLQEKPLFKVNTR